MFDEIISKSASIVAPTVGQIVKTDLIRAVRTYIVELRVRLTVTLAGGPATAILNGGTPWAVFERAGLDENGTRRVDVDPRLIALWTAMFVGQDIDKGRVRQTSLADGAYNLEETIFLAFSGYPVAGPSETLFLERNVANAFSAFVKLNTLNAAGKIVATGGTAVVSAVQVDVVQRYDWNRAARTILLPVVRQDEMQVNGTSAEFLFKIQSERYLQGLIVQQDTTGAGEVDDIITSLALRADGRDIYGPDLVPYRDLQLLAQSEFASDEVVTRGNLPIWFRKGGRLSNILNPNTLSNLRLVMNVTPSVVAGAGTSNIRVALLELERVPGLTADTVPFEV